MSKKHLNVITFSRNSDKVFSNRRTERIDYMLNAAMSKWMTDNEMANVETPNHTIGNVPANELGNYLKLDEVVIIIVEKQALSVINHPDFDGARFQERTYSGTQCRKAYEETYCR